MCYGRNGSVYSRVDFLTDVGTTNAIKSCFVFTVACSTLDTKVLRPFRDPLGPLLGTRIANQLRAQGFRVTAVKPGKACDAGFGVEFPKFQVAAVLSVTRRSGVIECDVLTWCIKHLWRRVSPDSLADGWTSVCVAINEILRQDSNVTALQWLTEDQAANKCWEEREWKE